MSRAADARSAGLDPRSAELRSQDWRILAGGGGGDWSATGSADDGAQRYLLVLAEPAARTLRRAAACLGPGGVCFIQWRRPRLMGPRRLRRQLGRSGFSGAEHYWSWPPSHRGPPRFWLPIDAPGAVKFFLATRPTVRETRRFKARLRVGAWRAAWHAGVLSPISTVATKPGGHGSSLAAQIREHWASWGIGPRPRSVACIMLTGGESRLNKIVILAFAEEAEEPALAIKLARVPEAVPGIDREAVALRAAGDRSFSGVAEIPRVLFHEELCGTVAVGETPVSGVPLSTLITLQRYDEIASWVTDAFSRLAAGRQPVPAAGWWDRLVAPVISAFLDRFASYEAGPGIDRAVRALRALPALPIVPEHRDSSPWNVLRSATGRLALVDWESAEPDGLPGLDLAYFLANGAFLLEGTLGSGREQQTYGDMLDGSSVAGRVYERSMAQYSVATGVARPDLDSLRLLAWMLHAVVEFDRIVSTHENLPVAAAMRRSVYLALWRQDVARLQEI